MANRRRWTSEEEAILVQEVQNNPQNLSKCFMSVGMRIGRDPRAVNFRWYTKTRFTDEGRKAMLTIGQGCIFMGKNRITNGRIQPQRKEISPSVW